MVSKNREVSDKVRFRYEINPNDDVVTNSTRKQDEVLPVARRFLDEVHSPRLSFKTSVNSAGKFNWTMSSKIEQKTSYKKRL